MIKRYENKEHGFTLVELLVAMAAFGLIVVAITGIFIAATKTQMKAFALQNAQESGRYLLETMTKEIRMSQIEWEEIDGYPTAILSIVSPYGGATSYEFNNTDKLLKRGGYPISPDNINVTGNFLSKKIPHPRPTG